MPQTQLKFRIATPSDAPALLPLIRSAYRGESSRAGWTTEADLVSDDRIDEAGLLTKIAEPDGVVIMVTGDAGALVSCCEVLHRDNGVAYFGLFAVDPKRQAGGIGRQVLQYAEDYAARHWGCTSMEMKVIMARTDIISWYVRRGYRQTGERRPFPYGHLVNGKALRDDLYFEVLVKDISGSQ